MKGILFVIPFLIYSCSFFSNVEKERALEKPVLLKTIELNYPKEALDNNIQGKVDLMILVDTTGSVSDIKLIKSSGFKILDTAAINYSSKLKFLPIKEDGKKVSRWIKWNVNYKIDETPMETDKIKMLVFYRASGYVHESTETAIDMFCKLADTYKFSIDCSDDSTKINTDNLKNYDLLVFLNTSGDILDEKGKKALVEFSKSGKGFVGIHSAAATLENWDWYCNFIGACFDDHPEIQDAVIRVKDRDHLSTKHLPDSLVWRDEWYNWKKLPENADILLTVDENTYKGGKHGDFHPVSWCKEINKFRVWYTALGHLPEHYTDQNFIKHIVGGIYWAANK
ncbi:TonB family protein [Melioribacter sp. Ez-97]|uniref:TonB family protein n=1 Tax=Melioribacter sp. Ez-97 TaxID=3423434 RepID=UPI003EDB3E34